MTRKEIRIEEGQRVHWWELDVSLIFLRQHRDNVRLREEGEIRYEETRRQRKKELQGNMNDDMSRELGGRASEEFKSNVQEEDNCWRCRECRDIHPWRCCRFVVIVVVDQNVRLRMTALLSKVQGRRWRVHNELLVKNASSKLRKLTYTDRVIPEDVSTESEDKRDTIGDQSSFVWI